MKLRNILIAMIVLFNVGFILVASYIAFDYDPHILQDAYEVVSSIRL